jgi:hypothetical protein
LFLNAFCNIVRVIPDGHPKSPTYGHLKIPHPIGPKFQ